MPGFTTHYILGMKAYNDLPNNQLKYIIAKYRWLYQLGLQEPDMFSTTSPSCATGTTATSAPTCMNITSRTSLSATCSI